MKHDPCRGQPHNWGQASGNYKTCRTCGQTMVIDYTRSDAGQDIVMKHTDIRGGGTEMTKLPPESDQERKTRTDLSSLRMTDDESKAVQKTPNRVTLDSMLMKVVSEEFIHPRSLPSMTICVLMLRNGFALVGKSTPADPENFDEELGVKFAKEDAIRQMWQLEAYLLREKMSAPVEDYPDDFPREVGT